jgi:PKD repeat protein
MKRILIACILLLCIVSFASASYMCNYTPVVGQFATSGAGWDWIPSMDYSEAKDACAACGYGLPEQYHAFLIDSTNGVVWSGATNYTTFNTASTGAYNATHYVRTYGQCAGSKYIRLSDGACGGSTLADNVNYDYWYRSDVGTSLCIANSVWPPTCNFTGAPTNGVVPLTVSFTDLTWNITGGEVWNWSVSPAPGVSINAPASQNTIMTFGTIGNYSITHWVNNTVGSSTAIKNDYIWVYNSTATITTAFRATDGATGNRITGATIHLNDVENGSWSNTSTVLGVASISVLAGHHISAYANATGFSDGEYLNAPAMAWTYDIMMLPTGFANVSAGNVTAYITVTDGDTLQKMYGTYVRAAYSSPSGSVSLESQTNSAGVASFVLPNKTDVHFSANKEGYGGANVVINTGTGSGGDAHVEGEIKLYKNTVTPTITTTTLPGGGTPVPTLTYLANCNPSLPDYDAAKCRTSKGGMGLNILADNLENLIWLVLIVTMIYLLKGIGK